MSDIKEKKDKKVSKNMLYLFIALAVVVIAAVVITILLINARKSEAELKYGDYSISKEKYDQLIKEAQDANVSSDDAREVLTKSLKAQDAAKKVGISESSYKSLATSAVLQQAGRRIGDPNQESYYQRAQYEAAIQNELDFLSKGGYKFATFEFPFSKRLYGPMMDVARYFNKSEQELKKLEAEMSHDKIREDVAYAKAKAEKYRADLIAKRISPQEAVNQIRNDDRLDHGGSSNTSAINFIPEDGVKNTIVGDVTYHTTTKILLDSMKPGEATPVQDVVGSGYVFSYPEELNVPGGVRTGYNFLYYIERIQARKDIKQQYKNALEGR